MLTFFRKHQRIFFIFTTFVIVVSFLFFGTFSSLNNDSQKVKEEFLVKGLDGSSISKQQVERVARFLSSSQNDLKDDRIQTINLLNDGVLEKDFLEAGLGQMLAERYLSFLQQDMKETLERVRAFRSYAHARVPYLNAEAIWSQFAPGSTQVAHQLREQKETISSETFEQLVRGYLQQRTMPSVFLKRILLYQQSQTNWIPEDPALEHADLSLLGLHTAQDWFGEHYLQLVAQFILNASAYEESLGYKVSHAEAKESLLQNLQEGIRSISRDVDAQNIDLYQAFAHQVRMLGCDEPSCLEVWKKVLLFRKLFQNAGNALVLDPLMFEDFNAYAKQKAKLDCYSLPSSLQMRDFLSMLKLQVYVQSISPQKNGSLSLPREFFSLAEIERRAPELVQKEYELEFAEIDLKKMASEVSLKEMWAWQKQDDSWALLKKQFPILAKYNSETEEERTFALESLDEKVRSDADRFSRERIVQGEPQKVREALARATMTQKEVGLGLSGHRLPFKGVKDVASLLTLLDKAPLRQQGTLPSEEEAFVQDKLSFYTGDEQHYYAIYVLRRGAEKKVLTFAEASNNGALDQLLSKRLEEAYPEVRKKEAAQFLQKDGTWKPLSEVREQVGMLAFSDLLKAIDLSYRSYTGKEPSDSQKKSPEFYAHHRLLSYMNQSLEQLKQSPEDPQWVDVNHGWIGSGEIDPLTAQWRLSKQVLSISRSKKDFFATEEAFTMPSGNWSSVVVQPRGMLCFYIMLEKESAEGASLEEVQKTKAPLLYEMQRRIMAEMLDKIHSQQAIVL